MINLIPPEGHRAVRKEYLVRVSATYCFLFAVVFILLTVSLIPTYVLVRAQMHAYDAEVSVQTEGGEIKIAEEDTVRTEAILTELRKTPNTPNMSVIIREIENAATRGISFRNFSLQYTANTLDPILVQGVADRREDLVAFKQAVEAHALFEGADIPLTDLAKERDVPFTITIRLAELR